MREELGVGQGLLLIRWKRVVCVGRDRDRLSGAAQRVTHDGVVAVAAEQDSHRGRVLFLTELVVDDSDVETELPHISGLKLADLQFDHHVAQLHGVEEEQIEEVLVAVDLEPLLPADEGEPVAELKQCALKAIHQPLLELALRNLTR